MIQTSGILLNENWTNTMNVGGELGWFIESQNASTGYHWQFIPDNSGTYELAETVNLHPSVVNAVGVPGAIIWKLKAVRAGKGQAKFELLPPGSTTPAKTITITIEVA